MEQSFFLYVDRGNEDKQQIKDLVTKLNSTLNKPEYGIRSERVEAPATSGTEKGFDILGLVKIIFDSSALQAFASILKTFSDTNPSAVFHIKKSDGSFVEIKVDDLTDDNLDKLQKTVDIASAVLK